LPSLLGTTLPTVQRKANIEQGHRGDMNIPNTTGSKTEQGRKRCAAAKTIRGRETLTKRQLRAEKLRELRELEGVLKLKGLLT
jgi:hypothetical protein